MGPVRVKTKFSKISISERSDTAVKQATDSQHRLALLERGPRLEFHYSYGLADFCRGAAIAREFGGTESVEVTLLTEV